MLGFCSVLLCQVLHCHFTCVNELVVARWGIFLIVAAVSIHIVQRFSVYLLARWGIYFWLKLIIRDQLVFFRGQRRKLVHAIALLELYWSYASVVNAFVVHLVKMADLVKFRITLNHLTSRSWIIFWLFVVKICLLWLHPF